MRFAVEDLEVRAGKRPVARHVSFTLDPGQMLLLDGPLPDRTRVLRALAGLDPVRGRLTLDGRPPEAWGWPAWRTKVTFVPHRVPQLPGSPKALHRALTALGHGTLGQSPSQIVRPWGLSASRLQQPWKDLHPSEARRALLALVLARDPAVVLLDQPTAALDPRTALAVEDVLAKRAGVWATSDPAQIARLVTRGARTLSLTPP